MSSELPPFQKDVLEVCKEFRNKVMRPVNLILEGNYSTDWACRLIKLNKLWTKGKKAIDYLGNPKNTYIFREDNAFADEDTQEVSYHGSPA